MQINLIFCDQKIDLIVKKIESTLSSLKKIYRSNSIFFMIESIFRSQKTSDLFKNLWSSSQPWIRITQIIADL